MSHGLFLGSALTTQDQTPVVSPLLSLVQYTQRTCDGTEGFLQNVVKTFRPVHTGNLDRDDNTTNADRLNSSLSFVKVHLHRGVVDLVNLLGLAVIINSM